MCDSPRPSSDMTATPNGTVSRSRTVRAVAFALAATLLPSLSHAATHRPARHGAIASAHGKVSAKTASIKSSHHNAELERAAATVTRKPAKGRAATAEVAATRSTTRRDAIEAARALVHGPNAVHANPIPMPDTVAPHKTESVEAAADRATQDRVHAWYKTRTAAPTADQTVADAAPAKPAHVKTVKAVATPDLSPVPHKATVEDFDRALQQQRQVIQAAQQQDQARTTDADDAAEAATLIPRTAPTARVAVPFVHGDLLTQQTASLDDDAPETPTMPLPTAQSAPAKVAAARAVIIRKEPAPAIAAVKSAAKKPELDTETAQALTDATFDDDAGGADKPAPTLAAKSAPVRRAVVASDDDMADAAVIPAVKVDLYDTRGHLKMLPAMKGTHEILVHQNQMAAADGLDRIEDDDQLQKMRHYKLLVSLPDNEAIQVNDPMPADRRYARPWTVRFLNDLSRAHYARFHSPLIITSAVRTVEFQKHLVRINGNAAPPTGDVASPHLYGQAIDLGKRGMSMTEIAWMRAYLTPVESSGKIDVEEEFQQSCFHISVYRRYLGLPQKKNAPVPDALPQRKMELVKATPAPSSKRRRRISALLAAGVR